MRCDRVTIAGFALALSVAGCSDSSPESGSVPFKAETSDAILKLRENMSAQAKGGAKAGGMLKPAPDAKPSDSKSAGTGTADKK
jgi:hypothetical protein